MTDSHPYSAATRNGIEWSTRGTIDEPKMRCIRGTATKVRRCMATVSGQTVGPNDFLSFFRISRRATDFGEINAFLHARMRSVVQRGLRAGNDVQKNVLLDSTILQPGACPHQTELSERGDERIAGGCVYYQRTGSVQKFLIPTSSRYSVLGTPFMQLRRSTSSYKTSTHLK